jgi:F-type H+-transporting ATPase subunit a
MESNQTESNKTESTQTESAETESPLIEAPLIEAPQIEAPQIKAAQTEPAQTEFAPVKSVPTEPVRVAPAQLGAIQGFFMGLWLKFRAWVDANPRRAALWGGGILIFIIGFFIPVEEPHVSLAGEAISSGGPAWLTNSVVTTVIVDIILILIAVTATMGMKLVPGGWQNFVEYVVEGLYGLSESVAGKNARQFFPWVMTIFLFVIISNYSGLIPGVGSIGFYHPYPGDAGHALETSRKLAMVNGSLTFTQPVYDLAAPGAAVEGGKKFIPLFRAPSADLNVTFALAIITMVMVQVWGVRALGAGYFRKFWNIQGEGFMKGIYGFVSILEIVAEFSRILAFGFRLFGNIFAGEIMLATMAFLITFFVPMPFYAFEIFVGFVQAFVFMMLALVFFTMATISHGHDDHGDAHAAH